MSTITITRHLARELRAVFRRNLPGHPPRDASSPIVLRADGGQLRAHHRYGPLAIEHVGLYPQGDTAVLTLPLQALADSEGRDDLPVTLESSDPGSIVTRWIDRGIPRVRVDPVEPDRPQGEPLSVPTAWREMPGEVLDALADAVQVAGESGRYALDCLQLDGKPRRVVATDGRQLLIRSGFEFPWHDEVLIDASPIFGCAAIPRDRPVWVGRTDTHVVIRAGSWTIGCEIRTGVRFPDVDSVLPASSGEESVVRRSW